MEAKLWEARLFSPTLPLLPPTPRLPSLNLHFPSSSTSTLHLARNSVSDTVPIQNEEKEQTLSSVKPTYSPTLPNRDLRTPHSGYFYSHFSIAQFQRSYFY